jgi:hypothetical protein
MEMASGGILILAMYALVPVGIVYGAYRLIRYAIRRELQERDRH